MDTETTTPAVNDESPADTETNLSPAEQDTPETPEARADSVSREEHKKVEREAQNLRKRLRDLEDAQKTETQRLQDRAAMVDTLEPQLQTVTEERDSLKAALADVVKAQSKALPKEIVSLMPDGSPVEQMAWLLKAQDALPALKPDAQLPPAGHRQPANGNGNNAPTKEQQDAATRRYTGQW